MGVFLFTKLTLQATGNVGSAALKRLLESNFIVTVLARKLPASLPTGVSVKVVDYGSVQSLTDAVRGQDAVVDATNTPGTTDVAKHLIDAAVAAGVDRIIPSEYSGNPNNTPLRSLPPFVGMAEVYNYLQEKTRGTETTWTTISNNAFLDWCMRYSILNIDLKNKKFTRLDDGSHQFEWTLLDSVGRGIAGALEKPVETENRNCYIRSVKKSQNQMFELAKGALGGEWQVGQADAHRAFEEAMVALQQGNGGMQVMADIIRYAAVTPEISVPFPSNDNTILGVPEMSDDELRELFRKIASE